MVGLGGGVRRGVVGGDDGGERSGVSSCRRNGRRLSSSTGTRGDFKRQRKRKNVHSGGGALGGAGLRVATGWGGRKSFHQIGWS